MTSPASAAGHREPGLLRNQAFVLLFSGMAISLLGNSLYQIVIPVWVIQTTGLAGDIALVTGTATVIRLLIAPLAGTVADRSDRRWIMLSADLTQAAIVTLLALAFWSGMRQFGLLLVGGALLAVAGAFFSPAYAAAQTSLVHPQDLTRSLSLWQMMGQTVAFVGPALAGVVVAVWGHTWALALDGVTFLVSALCILLIRLHWVPSPPKHPRPFWRDFAGGTSQAAPPC